MPSIAPDRTIRVVSVHRLVPVVAAVAGLSFVAPGVSSLAAPPVDPLATTTTAAESNLFVPVPDSVPGEEGQVDDEPTVTTTTTTLPSAVTTLPPGCASPPVPLAVFTGTVTGVESGSVRFRVDQVRTGTLDAFLVEGEVTVRYGGDARYLEGGSRYIVGVVAGDSVGSTLASTLRDEAAVLGEAEGLAGRIDCPDFEPVARTLTIEGGEVATGTFSLLFDSPIRLLAAFVLPALLVLVLLVGAVWTKRALRE